MGVVRQCEAEEILFSVAFERCMDQATGYFMVGCEHEHIRECWLCAWHSGHPELAVCPDCEHTCRTLVVGLPYDENMGRSRDGGQVVHDHRDTH